MGLPNILIEFKSKASTAIARGERGVVAVMVCLLYTSQILKDNNYQCEMCKDKGIITVATEVHHIIPLSIDFNKRLDDDNLMALCESCHDDIHRE